MKKRILLIAIIVAILSGCSAGYKKVDGELMRVYLTNRDIKKPVAVKPCFYQAVPTGYRALAIITKGEVFIMPFPKQDVEYLKKNDRVGEELRKDTVLNRYYQEALEEGVTEWVCTDKKRTEKDIFHKTGYLACPTIRESHYTKDDKEFLEIFKNEILLRDYLEIPASLGKKIYERSYPAIVYTKEILEQAMVAPNRAKCLAMPLKTNPPYGMINAVIGFDEHGEPIFGPVDTSYDRHGNLRKRDAPPGMFFKSYSSKKERKNMLKDKDPNIYWEYPAWGGFFTPDGKVNKERIKELKEKTKARKNSESK